MSVDVPTRPQSLTRTDPVLARNRVMEKIGFASLTISMLIVVSMVAWVLGYIVYEGIGTINLEFLTSSPNYDSTGGIFPAIIGTLYVIAGTILFALPVGVAGAIYLSEYAGRSRIVRLVRLAIINLAGVPTIVHGLFGLGFFVYFVGGILDRFVLGRSPADAPVFATPCLLWGFCTMAVVVLPIIITLTEEALRAVPRSFREGSLGLGASKWQTIWRVILPTALPGIMTSVILSVGRVAGETAPILVTCAASFKPLLPRGLNDQAITLPTHLYFTVMWVADSPFRIQAAIALALVALVFSINVVAIIARARMRGARKW